MADPNELHVYSPLVDASYSHNFAGPGTYDISLFGRSNASLPIATFSINNNIVETFTNVDGEYELSFRVDIENTDPTLIAYSFDSNGDNNFELFISRLEIDGPIDPNEGALVDERRVCAFHRRRTRGESVSPSSGN